MPLNSGITRRVAVTLAALIAIVVPLSSAASAWGRAPARGPAAGRVTYRHACPKPADGQMACLAIVDSNAAGQPLSRAAAAAAGLHPYMAADLQAAYKLPSLLLGERQTVAVVDAYDDPNAEADLAVYRTANNLPPCTTANGCFTEVNQKGQPSPLPPSGAGTGWPIEESLDLDMVSAACPNCHIVMVEARNADQTGPNLEYANDAAVRLGANVISNSWGGNEYNGETADCNRFFNHPGVAITVASGDSGFAPDYPAACEGVTAVGGTTLYQDTSARGWGEIAWSGTGSGCSAYIPKPSWQHDRLCGKRTFADTAAVADPNTPVAFYDTYNGVPGWVAVGGTSVAAPIVAGVYALAGNTAAIGAGASFVYAHHTGLFDVTSGSDGTCGGSYLCTAVKAYDGPTGWGTPDGIGAF